MTLKPIAARAARFVVFGASVLLVACAGAPKSQAPVEDRYTQAVRQSGTNPAPAPVEAPKPPPGAENAGKPGYYTVRPGDTLIRVGLETGQNWRDLQRWNGLDNPDRIEVGQVLRVLPPGQDASAATVRPVTPPRVADKAGSDSKSLPPAAGTSAPLPAIVPVPVPVPVPAAPAPSGASAAQGDDDLNWLWPAQGQVVAAFDDSRNKGIAIAGRAGDPVIAAADGRVVYAGSGLRGYGNLVIIKHNDTFLTAYAHNQALLVREDQAVKRGQKIAEMGSTDADRVQLHFEIRRRGKPVDPARYLPNR
ncbi:peptidoglycan DD-metalloendopeptidase family protein [Leptothrix discophora]|uniref:Peptidoglycan DD-metalloendopeptidase family protein n=1 Tax=Leptothrix discophora TaxID=89 RepID=A0ABT9FZ60_LEPDI|nr:peptidoglycan DD-metalloendopeptidase family protein [Leptothrix discophora]MDP4299517.1 peptidoglycan DD-metalloendopeptidase family protein [Leptothrix discophora]